MSDSARNLLLERCATLRRAVAVQLTSSLATGRAIELDAIRGLAILLAMGWHLNKPTHTFIDIFLLPGRRIGWVGVDIFFVLSGFLIGGLILREIDKTNSFDTKRFLIRRAFRLWPMLYLYIIFQLIVGRFPPIEYVPQILFHVQNFFTTPFSHLWSLAVEEQFYFIAALALPFMARAGLSDRKLLAGLAILICLSTALRTWGWMSDLKPTVLQFQTQFRADVLCAGIFLATLKLRLPEIYAALQKQRIVFALIAAGAAYVLFSISSHLKPLVGYPAGLVLGVALIISLDGIRLGRAARIIAKPLAFMGLYSYTMYIWHNGVGNAVYRKAEPILSAAPARVLSYIAVIVFSVILTRLVERPMIQLRDRLFPGAQHRGSAERVEDEIAARASA